MQRFLPMLPGIVTAVLVSSPALWGQEAPVAPEPAVRHSTGPHHAEVIPAPTCNPKNHGSVRAANEKLVRELVAILKKTKSQDTFLVTVRALEDIGPRSKAAVPSIILNAERLGLLKDILVQAEDEEKDGPGVIIAEAIEHIVAPRRGRDVQAPRPGGPIGYPPPVPPPPCVVSPLMCPVAPPAPPVEVQPPKTARR